MSAFKDQVKYIASLSRLRLAEAEEQKFANQLSDILSFVEKLNELDTQDVQPTYHVLSLENVFRLDQVKPSLSREEALLNAPKQQDGMFMVPSVLGE